MWCCFNLATANYLFTNPANYAGDITNMFAPTDARLAQMAAAIPY
jgi:hypothetical protein